MSRPSGTSWLGWLLLAGAMLIVAGVLGLQRYRHGILREEEQFLRARIGAGRELREDNERLKRSVPSAEALAQLRSDHAAVLRLRTEVEQMKARAEGMERSLATRAAPP